MLVNTPATITDSSVEHSAGLLALVAAATGRVARQPDRYPRDRVGLNRATPTRLTGPGPGADPATQARTQADLDPDRPPAGTALRRSRHVTRRAAPAPARERPAVSR